MTTTTDTIQPSTLSSLNALLAAKRGDTPSAADILAGLRKSGIELFPTLDRKGLELRSGTPTDEQRGIIKAHRAALLDYLTGPTMKFDFWVPNEADQILKVLLVRMKHHDWPGSQITRRQYANLQDEFDAAWEDKNLERLKRAESNLHTMLDVEPFYIDVNESEQGHGGRIWYDQATQGGLVGSVQPSTFSSWRVVAKGVPQTEREALKSYLLEYRDEIGKDCQLKIDDTGVNFER